MQKLSVLFIIAIICIGYNPLETKAVCIGGPVITNTKAYPVCLAVFSNCGGGNIAINIVVVPPFGVAVGGPNGCCITMVQVWTPPPGCLPQTPPVNCPVFGTCPMGGAYPAGATIIIPTACTVTIC